MTNSRSPRSRTGDSHRSRKKDLATLIIIVFLALVIGAIVFFTSKNQDEGSTAPQESTGKRALYEKADKESSSE